MVARGQPVERFEQEEGDGRAEDRMALPIDEMALFPQGGELIGVAAAAVAQAPDKAVLVGSEQLQDDRLAALHTCLRVATVVDGDGVLFRLHAHGADVGANVHVGAAVDVGHKAVDGCVDEVPGTFHGAFCRANSCRTSYVQVRFHPQGSFLLPDEQSSSSLADCPCNPNYSPFRHHIGGAKIVSSQRLALAF